MRRPTTYAFTSYLLVLSCFFFVSPHQLSAEPVQGTKGTMGEIALEMRKLYLDTYPDLKRLEQLRTAGNRDRANQLRRELEQTISPRLQKVKQKFRSLNPSDVVLKRKMKSFKNMITYFDRYQHKILTNWSPDNKKVYKAFNEQELIDKELAKPEMLRRKFLSELVGKLRKGMYVTSNPIVRNTSTYRERVESLHWKVLPKFLDLLEQVDTARRKDEQDEQAAVKSAQQEWQSFWEELQLQQKDISEGINRELLLFRDRKHMPTYQDKRKNTLLRLKRQFQEIMKLRVTEEIFSDKEKIRSSLIFLGKKLLFKVGTLLKDNFQTVQAFLGYFKNVYSRATRVSDNEQFQSFSDQLDQKINGVYDQIQIDEVPSNLQDVPEGHLDTLALRLTTDYGKKEKKLGTVFQRIKQFTKDLKSLADRANSYPRDFQETYRNLSFKSRKEFRDQVDEQLRPDWKEIQDALQKAQKQFQTIKSLTRDIKSTDFLSKKETE